MCSNEFSPARRGLAALCNLATLGNLAIVSRDRYLAARKPSWYLNHMTPSLAIKMKCVPWLINDCICDFFSTEARRRIQLFWTNICLLFYLICFFVIIFCYLSIYCKPTLPQQFLHICAILEREKRLANTVGSIMLVLLLTFLPALICPAVLYVK